MTFVSSFTLDRMIGNIAVIGINGTLSTTGPTFTPTTFNVIGRAYLDLKAGHAAKATVEMKGSTATPMGEMHTKVRTLMTTK
nr:hypothetical protein [uncultured bacterium]